MDIPTSDLNFRKSLVKYANRFGVTKASKEFKVSRSFVYKLLNKYDGTAESLRQMSRRPKYHPKATTHDEYDHITNYTRRNPDTGLVVLWVKLRKAGYTRCITTLYRSLIRLGLKTSLPKKPKYKPFIYPPSQYY